jgi:hypothetical protein
MTVAVGEIDSSGFAYVHDKFDFKEEIHGSTIELGNC